MVYGIWYIEKNVKGKIQNDSPKFKVKSRERKNKF